MTIGSGELISPLKNVCMPNTSKFYYSNPIGFYNFESILPKDHPCHVCFKLADWFHQRRLLNNFPIGPMLKLCPLMVSILDRDRGH